LTCRAGRIPCRKQAKLLGGFDDAFGGMGGNLASPIEPKKFSLMILCFDQADVS